MQGCIREQRHTDRKLPGMYMNNHKGQATGGSSRTCEGNKSMPSKIRVPILCNTWSLCVLN